MNYDELIYSITSSVKEEIEFEHQNGSSKNYFMAYSNLLKELNPLKINRNIKDIWLNYRVFIKASDLYRDMPDFFSDITRIKDFSNISNIIKEGGVIVTFHYGNYRNIIYSIATKILNEFPDTPIAIIVDTDSYNNEPEKWLNVEGCEFFIAESPTIGIQLARHIKKGGWVFVFLDGNTGSGVDKKGLHIDFLSSKIEIRSGLFRLLSHMGKPMIPVIADGPLNTCNFTIYNPVYTSSTNIEDTAQSVYDSLKTKMINSPEYWRFWFRHHLQVKQWCRVCSNDEERRLSNLKCISDSHVLIMDEVSGQIYKMKNS